MGWSAVLFWGNTMIHRLLLSCLITLMIVSSVAFGQGGGVNLGGGNQGGNQGGGAGGNGNGGVGGIRIDASGLVERVVIPVMNARALQKLLESSAAKSLPSELNHSSDQRKVSLRDLDREIDRLLTAKQPLADAIGNLAGLTRIDYVFIADDGHDVIIAGPAEGFAMQPDGRVVGIVSHRPVLCLDDLLVAIRTASEKTTFGCSFDPEPARLAQTQQLLKQNTRAASASAAQQGFQQIGGVLGHWNVRVFGLPESSHMAAAMVDADFALKRLTTGDENPQVAGFKSYFSMMRPNADSMRRWWFSPRYEAIEANAQQTAFRFSGPRLQVSAQDEIVDANGNRQDAPATHVSLEKYAQQFTEKIPALAENVPAIAQLQNMVDLLVTVALIGKTRAAGRLDWDPLAFNDEQRLPVQQFGVSKETPSIVKVRMAGSRTVMGLIAGGVMVTPRRVLADMKPTADEATLELPVRTDQNSSWWWD